MSKPTPTPELSHGLIEIVHSVYWKARTRLSLQLKTLDYAWHHVSYLDLQSAQPRQLKLPWTRRPLHQLSRKCLAEALLWGELRYQDVMPEGPVIDAHTRTWQPMNVSCNSFPSRMERQNPFWAKKMAPAWKFAPRMTSTLWWHLGQSVDSAVNCFHMKTWEITSVAFALT